MSERCAFLQAKRRQVARRSKWDLENPKIKIIAVILVILFLLGMLAFSDFIKR
jgi:hypothetical protein